MRRMHSAGGLSVLATALATVERDELEVEHIRVYGLPTVLSEPPDL